MTSSDPSRLIAALARDQIDLDLEDRSTSASSPGSTSGPIGRR